MKFRIILIAVSRSTTLRRLLCHSCSRSPRCGRGTEVRPPIAMLAKRMSSAGLFSFFVARTGSWSFLYVSPRGYLNLGSNIRPIWRLWPRVVSTAARSRRVVTKLERELSRACAHSRITACFYLSNGGALEHAQRPGNGSARESTYDQTLRPLRRKPYPGRS